MKGGMNLDTASIESLVTLFESIAVKQNAALESFRTAEYNRLYELMDKVQAQLKLRDGDQRRALLSLYHHPNPTVRFKAAMATFALVPHDARNVLQTIKDQKEFPVAMSASQMLSAIDEGRFIPT